MLKEELQVHFECYGITVTEPVLEKCVEICEQYNIKDTSLLVDEWLAYSVSNLNGADPTVESLNQAVLQGVFTKVNKEPAKEVMDQQVALLPDDDVMKNYIDSTSPEKTTALQSSVATTQGVSEVAVKVFYTFGRSDIVKMCQWKRARQNAIKASFFRDGVYFTSIFCYMKDYTWGAASVEAEKINVLGEQIRKWLRQNQPNKVDEDKEDDESGIIDCDQQSLMKVTCLGQICYDVDKCVYLNNYESSGFKQVQLDLNNCKAYSVFSGQIAMVEGMNPRGDTLKAECIYTSTPLQNYPKPRLAEPISLVICAGPYTTKHDMTYQPLTKLISYCKENEPDVIILTGAFIDRNVPIQFNLKTTYNTHLEKTLTEIANCLKSTHILIVASQQDANSLPIYPTPAYDVEIKKQKIPNLHILPDPCIVDIDGLTVGLTSTDVIGHLSANEISHNDGVDKTKRAVSYLFNSKTFYPLRPSAESVNLDHGVAADYCKLDIIPNLMVLPSSSREFIRDYYGCLCINPGALAGKESETGKFARLVVHPPNTDKSKWFDHVAGQIISI